MEDILASSLESLYGYAPISEFSPGEVYSYPVAPHAPGLPSPTTLHLRTPDTNPANWNLHANYLWVAGRFLADHASDLHLPNHPDCPIAILELGAASGLPSILLATLYGPECVRRFVLSDYPDPRVIQTLEENVRRNCGSSDNGRCRVVAHAWGTEGVPALLEGDGGDGDGFDVIIAGDVLFDASQFPPLLETINGSLRRTDGARVYLVAGFHTGRYAIDAFLRSVRQHPHLNILEVKERRVTRAIDAEDMQGSATSAREVEREWRVDRAEVEDEQERRRWVVWIVLKRTAAPC